jgi:hypothetical protein
MTTPQIPSNPVDRQLTLVDHFDKNRDRFTVEALRASALTSGYGADEIDTAIRLAVERDAQRQSIRPVRKRARYFVLSAYGIVWVLFALAYLGPDTSSSYNWGVLAQAILTLSLGLGLAISLAIIARGRPDPSQPSRAMFILLVVPVVLLLVVTGLCLPYLPQA